MSAPRDPIVEIGRVGAPHGVRGAVRVRLHNPDSPALRRGAFVWLAPAGETTISPIPDDHAAGARRLLRMRVLDALPAPDGRRVRFDRIGDRTTAEGLHGAAVVLYEHELPPTAPGEYYHHQMIGLRVVAPDGTARGVCTGVDDFGAGELLRVRCTDGEERWVPWRPVFVTAVDTAAGTIVVDVPPGLLDDGGAD